MDARLAALRARIAAVDQELVHLAAERLTLAAKVGQAKLAQGLPIRNYETEAEVLARYRRHAEGEGVEPEFARRLATLLIGEAVRRQEDGRTPEGEAIARATPAGSQRILVVGGGGRWAAGWPGS
ncbi:MAG: chorismate mutase, partial [Gemmatimonadota bacterium]